MRDYSPKFPIPRREATIRHHLEKVRQALTDEVERPHPSPGRHQQRLRTLAHHELHLERALESFEAS